MRDLVDFSCRYRTVNVSVGKFWNLISDQLWIYLAGQNIYINMLSKIHRVV